MWRKEGGGDGGGLPTALQRGCFVVPGLQGLE